MDSFRVNFTTSSSPGGNHLTLPSLTGPSPLSYSPNVALIHSTSPRTQFGTAHRFLPSKVGYISPRHNSDLLCTASPGPKYNVVPTAATFPRQPCLGWGDRNQLEQREKRQGMAAMAMQASDVGPAAYTPRVQSVKPAAPRCAFSRSDRFGGPFGSYQTLNNSLGNGGSTSTANWDTVLSSSPRYSFGGGGEKELRNGVLTDRIHARQKPRTSFMTHSIRGGLARPATLECNIGPGDYSPQTGDIGSRNYSVKSSFGSSSRFLKPGIQFVSGEHSKANVGQTGPGPKYLVTVNNVGYQAKTPRTSGLKWIP